MAKVKNLGHILHYQEWQTPLGDWMCNDVSDLAGISGYWWVPARMLGISPAAFVQLLIEKFQPDKIKFTGNVLMYSWSNRNYNKCHSFVLWLNKESRDRKYIC